MKSSPDVYFLNLDRHSGRLENMVVQLNDLGLTWERVTAIDATKAKEEELNEYVDPIGPIPRMGAGARACTVGHFKIWETFLETEAPTAFVLEDDIKISNNFPAFLKFAVNISNCVDILNFNRQDSKNETKKLVVSRQSTLNSDEFVAKRLLSAHYGTAGYMITRSAAEKLCNQLKRTNVPIDHLLFNPNVSSYNRSARIYQAFPALVEPDVKKFRTSIQDEAIPESMKWHKKLIRTYYETNRIPSLLLQYLLGRAEIQTLDFEKSNNSNTFSQ